MVQDFSKALKAFDEALSMNGGAVCGAQVSAQCHAGIAKGALYMFPPFGLSKTHRVCPLAVHYLQGRYDTSLEHSLKALASEPERLQTLILAAKAALLLGAPAQGLKYSSKALFVKPQVCRC